MRALRLPLLLGLLLTTGACAPSLAPLYRDYAAEDEVPPLERLATALGEAGWELAPPTAPNVIATEPRTVRQWGLYRVEAALEVVPVGGEHVRVYVHPYRRYITGGRSKIPYLKGSLRRALLPEITESFERQGLTLLGTPIQRDRTARAD